MRRLSLLLRLVATCVLQGCLCADTRDAVKGREFYVVFMESHDFASPALLGVFVTNPNTQTVQANITFHALADADDASPQIPAGGTHAVPVPVDMMLRGAALHNRSVVITAHHDVMVQASSDRNSNGGFTSAGFSVLPRAALTGNYVVATHCSTGQKCLFAVTSAEDGNDVAVTLRLASGAQAVYKDRVFGDDESFQERLDKGQSLQVTCLSCDLTGSWINASKDVAVFAGGQFSKLYSQAKDRVEEQMVPMETLGSSYVLPANAAKVQMDVKIVTLRAHDEFTYDGATFTSVADREVFAFRRNTGASLCAVRSQHRFLLAMLIGTTTAGQLPAEVLVVPVPESQWSLNYTLYVPGAIDSHLALYLVMPLGGEAQLNFSLDYTEVSSVSDSAYSSVELELETGGMLTVQCHQDPTVGRPGCQPFWAFLVYSDGNYRSASVTMRNFFPWNETIAIIDATTIADDTTSDSNIATTIDAPINATTDTIIDVPIISASIVNASMINATINYPPINAPINDPINATTDATTTTTPNPQIKSCDGKCRCVQNEVPSAGGGHGGAAGDTEAVQQLKQELRAAISRELSEEPTSLSSYTRTKQSAADTRDSAAITGLVIAVTSLTAVCAVIVLPDLLSLGIWLAGTRKNPEVIA